MPRLKLFDSGAKVRLAAMGTLFCLGATLGDRLSSYVPWYAWFSGAMVFGFAMALLFLRWADELERGV